MGILIQSYDDVWTRQGRKRTWEGRSEAAPESSSGQHSGYHQACHPPPGQERRGQENLWSDLRRDEVCLEGVSGKCDPRRSYLHRACQAQDGYYHGRGLRSQEAGTYSVRIWWLVCCSAGGGDIDVRISFVNIHFLER